MRQILLFCLALLTTGCSQWQTKKELKLFSKAEIRMPSNLQIVQNGIFSDDISDISSHSVKLIIYYGPEGCTSCKIGHLYELDQLFELKIDNQFFTPIIVVAPSEQNYKEVVKLLKCQLHTYPIYVDKENQFQKLNSTLPSDPRFHTFLLDKNNRVVLVGNPIAGETMWNLFHSTLDNMLAHDGIYEAKK